MLIKFLRVMLGTTLVICGAHTSLWFAIPLVTLGCLFLIDVMFSIYLHH